MLPTISAGSEVRVTSRKRRPKFAEIWAFCDATGTVVVHRYRRRDPAGRFVFQGDNVRLPDASVDDARLVGLVTHVRSDGAVRRVGIGAHLAWIGKRVIGKTRRRFSVSASQHHN